MSADISVIIAAHNVEHYIERAVNSALAQAETMEVIVVDDASTDGTRNVVSRIGDPRLLSIRLDENRGPGAARNAGISAASGRRIVVLDGDDAFLPGRLARLSQLSDVQEADIAVDNLSVCRESDGAIFPMFSSARLTRLGTLGLADFIAGNSSLAGGYALGYMKPVFSAAFLRYKGLRYPEGLRIGEDYFLLARALAQGARCAVDPAEGYSYTARAGSVSHRLTSADIRRIISADGLFISAHRLSAAAQKAQEKRSTGLKEAHAYACLVEAIKNRDLPSALRMAASAPLAARHLWRPAWARAQKFIPLSS
ncbi:MAG: glycosyltransferase family 2 protein [Alphaproteobacteria bacterium]|nr:glycosyltransferase family 2 protein [Alphaproteobacteria bacterium]